MVGLALSAAGVIVASAPARADGDLSGALGVTKQGEITARLGLVREWEDKRWWESDRGYLTGYWDTAWTYWEGSYAAGAHSLSFSPVFVYQFHGQRLRPFVEFGIGVSLFSKTRVGERKLGSAFNFEDRIGIGLILDDGSRIGLRAIHYSNADIKQPNMGIESFAFFYTKSFK